jgi:hypothetical protein
MSLRPGRRGLIAVAIGAVVVLAILVYVTGPWLSPVPPPCTSLECSPIFAAGDPVVGNCSAGSTYAADGCMAGDATFLITVESSQFTLGSLSFKVVDQSSGAPARSATEGGFSVLNQSGHLVAQSERSPTLEMTAGFEYPGHAASNGTYLTNVDSILVDMGEPAAALNGAGLAFVSTLSSTGASTSPLQLP